MAKKKTTKGHKSFKLTPHGQPTEKVLLYVVIAVAVGVLIGLALREQASEVLGISTYSY